MTPARRKRTVREEPETIDTDLDCCADDIVGSSVLGLAYADPLTAKVILDQADTFVTILIDDNTPAVHRTEEELTRKHRAKHKRTPGNKAKNTTTRKRKAGEPYVPKAVRVILLQQKKARSAFRKHLRLARDEHKRLVLLVRGVANLRKVRSFLEPYPNRAKNTRLVLLDFPQVLEQAGAEILDAASVSGGIWKLKKVHPKIFVRLVSGRDFVADHDTLDNLLSIPIHLPIEMRRDSRMTGPSNESTGVLLRDHIKALKPIFEDARTFRRVRGAINRHAVGIYNRRMVLAKVKALGLSTANGAAVKEVLDWLKTNAQHKKRLFEAYSATCLASMGLTESAEYYGASIRDLSWIAKITKPNPSREFAYKTTH